jgi:hypothetical protein
VAFARAVVSALQQQPKVALALFHDAANRARTSLVAGVDGNRPRPEGAALGGPPEGAAGVWKAPSGPGFGLRQIEFALLRLELLLFANVLPDAGFIQADRTHTVAGRPEVQPGHPTFME